MIIAEWTVNVPRADWSTAFKAQQPVRNGAYELKLWEDWEIDLLRDEELTGAEIAERTGRKQRNIYLKRSRLRKQGKL